MRKLMGHDGRKLRFVVGHFDGPAVDEHISTRQGKRVDSLIVHAVKCEGILHSACWELGREPHSQFRQIGVHFGRIAKRQLSLRIHRRSFAHLDVLLRGKHIPSGLQRRALGGGSRRQQKEQAQKADTREGQARLPLRRIPFATPHFHSSLPSDCKIRMAILVSELL